MDYLNNNFNNSMIIMKKFQELMPSQLDLDLPEEPMVTQLSHPRKPPPKCSPRLTRMMSGKPFRNLIPSFTMKSKSKLRPERLRERDSLRLN